MNRRYHFGLYLAIALLMVLVAIALPNLRYAPSSTNTGATWRYNQLVSEVQRGQVEQVRISADRTRALVTTVEGDQVTVSLPNDPELISILTSNDVEISVSNQSENLFWGWVLLLAIAVVTSLGFAFWIWTIVDCATNESSEGNNKLIWILIILFTGWIGALIYFFVRRPQRVDDLRR